LKLWTAGERFITGHNLQTRARRSHVHQQNRKYFSQGREIAVKGK